MIDALGEIVPAVSAAFSESLPYVSAFAAAATAAAAWAVYRDQSSPDVVVYVSQVSAGSSVVGLFIENIGKAPAYDLAFEVEGDLPMSDGMRDGVSTFLGHGISLLMPGARRGTFLGVAHELLSKEKDAEATVSVAFARRRGGRRVRASFPVDVLSFDRALLEKPSSLQKVEELAKQSKRAADELRAARRSMERMESKLEALLPSGKKE